MVSRGADASPVLRAVACLLLAPFACTSSPFVRGNRVLNCGDPTVPPTPAEIDATPRADPVAEQLALEVCTTATASPSVYAQILDDLAAIRATEPRIERLLILFDDDAMTLELRFDAASFDQVRADNYMPWLSLNARYVVTDLDTSDPNGQHMVYLQLKGRYRLATLADEYGALPGVLSARPGYLFFNRGPRVCAALEGQEMHYVVAAFGGDCPAGCTELQAYYFVTAPGQPLQYRGQWDSTAFLHGDLPDWFGRYCGR
jgi:hypothetical protein